MRRARAGDDDARGASVGSKVLPLVADYIHRRAVAREPLGNRRPHQATPADNQDAFILERYAVGSEHMFNRLHHRREYEMSVSWRRAKRIHIFFLRDCR